MDLEATDEVMTVADDLDEAAKSLQGIKILSAPAPRPTARRPYTPKPPPVDGLTEAVWDSFQRPAKDPEKFKLIPVPPDLVEPLRAFLLQAKNFLNWKHSVDIRGLEKKDVEIIDRDLVTDPEVRKLIPAGHVALRFTARGPMNKGMRARQARLAARGADRVEEVKQHRKAR